MSFFVKNIVTAVEQVVQTSQLPVREHFPINVVSHQTTFLPRKATIEIIITEPLSDEKLRDVDHACMYEFGRMGVDIVRVKYWPPMGGTGSILITVRLS